MFQQLISAITAAQPQAEDAPMEPTDTIDADMTEGTPDRDSPAVDDDAHDVKDTSQDDNVASTDPSSAQGGDSTEEKEAIDEDMFEAEGDVASTENPGGEQSSDDDDAKMMSAAESEETPDVNQDKSKRGRVRRPSVKLRVDEAEEEEEMTPIKHQKESDDDSEPEENEPEASNKPIPSSGIPLATSTDTSNLTPILCYIRTNCLEYFTATLTDGGSPQRGRRSRIFEGRVGIRCVFCKHLPMEERGRQCVAFPNGLDKIYSAVVMWQCRHVPNCTSIPRSVTTKLSELLRGGPNNKNHWVNSAKEKGLIDTREGGIMFESQEAMEAAQAAEVHYDELDGEEELEEETVYVDMEGKPRKKREAMYSDVETPRGSSRGGNNKWSTKKRKTRGRSVKNDEESVVEEKETWECTHCGSVNTTKQRCGHCKYYRESPQKQDEWECLHCGSVHPSTKLRCGDCYHFKPGHGNHSGPGARKRSLSPSRLTRSASPRAKRSISSSPQIRGKGGQGKNINLDDTWECCGQVYSSERRRCTFCHYGRGKAGAGAGDKGTALPPGIELIATPKKHCCHVRGCNKNEQSGNDGFCRAHYNLIVLGSESKRELEQAWTCDCGNKNDASRSRCACMKWRGHKRGGFVEPLPQDAPKHKSGHLLCKIPGCDKYKQSHCDDMCSKHYRQSVAKYDNVEKARKKSSPSPRKGARAADTDVRRSRSGRAVNPSPKARYHDEKEEEEQHGPKISLMCNQDGCTKYKQTGCYGYCCEHKHMGKNNVSGKKRVGSSIADNDIDGVTSQSPIKKKVKTFHSPVISKSPMKQQLKRLDSGVSVDTVQSKSESMLGGNLIKEGDMVRVEPGGALARVVKVNPADVNADVSYDIINIMGGREELVAGARLTLHRFGSMLPVSNVKNDAPQNKNTSDMLEMTRYKLLSGQDCWICTSCSVIVPSLAMSCGVCKMHPSFVPLEMKEFEEFVRGQRRKKNEIWLRRKELVSKDSPLTYLCKSQGCVQPGQISHDGYCESHIGGSLVRQKDRERNEASDFMYFLYKQMEPIVLNESDLLNPRDKDREIGEAGIACKHCKGRRSFPKGVDALRQNSFTIALANHMKDCTMCPKETKSRLLLLQEKEKTDKEKAGKDNEKPKNENKRAFLRRIWHRLERLSVLPGSQVCRLQGCEEMAKPNCDGLCREHRTAARLVLPHDHTVIKEYASLAFEQMQPCYLIDSDKTNRSNVNRSLSAPGLECRHCIGEPSHLRLFPAGETQLNELGAVGLIAAHMRICGSCPEKIKNKLASLAPGTESVDGLVVFYKRVWDRIQAVQK